MLEWVRMGLYTVLIIVILCIAAKFLPKNEEFCSLAGIEEDEYGKCD